MACDCISYNRPEPHQKTPEQVLTPPGELHIGRTTVCIDACIVDQVQALWAAGVVTQSTCCGHNDDEMRHVVVASEQTELAKATLSRFDRPLRVYSWVLVPA